MLKLIRDSWAFCDQKVYRRDGEEERDLISLAVIEKLDEIEFGHPEGWTAHVHGVDKVTLHSGDVGHGKMGDCSVVEAHLTLDHAASDVCFCDHVCVR